MTKKRVILAGAAVVLVVAAACVFRPAGKRVYLETTAGRYRVLEVRYLHGTNLTLAQDEPIAAWYRRARKAVGLPMKGFPGDLQIFGGVKTHAVAVLCDAPFPTNLMSQMAQTMEVECIYDAGRTLRFRDMGAVARNDDRFWLVWSYADTELPSLHRLGFADFPVTNFHPRQLCLFRKSDRRELTRLDVAR